MTDKEYLALVLTWARDAGVTADARPADAAAGHHARLCALLRYVRASGSDGGGGGGSWRRGTWQLSFSVFVRGEIVNGTMICSVWGGFVKRSVIIGLWRFLLPFEACVFAKQRGEYVIKIMVF